MKIWNKRERDKLVRYFWYFVGVALLVWVGWDLYAGYTFIWDIVYRETNPVAYWIALVVWTGLGVSCFFSWGESDR